MKVWLDGEPREVRAATPARALIPSGARWLLDEWGHRVGDEGSLEGDVAYFVLRGTGRPAAVHRCLQAWRPPLPVAAASAVVRHIINRARAAGGVTSLEATAAWAERLRLRRDPVIWQWLGGEGAGVRILPRGTARVKAFFPEVNLAVVPSRDFLTFPGGVTTRDYLEGLEIAEVGTTNKVKTKDYFRWLAPGAVALTAALASFEIRGFVAGADIREVANAARAAGAKTAALLGEIGLLEYVGYEFREECDLVILVAPKELGDEEVCFYPAQRAETDPRAAAAAPLLWSLAEGVYASKSG